MNTIFDVLERFYQTEETIEELDLIQYKEKDSYLYELIQDNIDSHKKQYELFCKIAKSSIGDVIYRNFLSLSRNQFEFVYFIKNETTGLIKIGMTKNPHDRLLAIKTSLNTATGIDNQLRYVGIICTTSTEMKVLEKRLHDKYALYRKFGEWFDLSEIHILNTYFTNAYKINNIPISIEKNTLMFQDLDCNVPYTIWEYITIHKIMDITGHKYNEINIKNIYLQMYLFYCRESLDVSEFYLLDDCIIDKRILNRIKQYI